MRRTAITLTELLTGIAILSILATVMILNGKTIGQQTAKREAERTAVFFRSHLLRAKMTHDVLWFTVSSFDVEVRKGKDFDAPLKTEHLHPSEKCSFSRALRFVYNVSKDVKHNGNTYKQIPDYASVDIGSYTNKLYCLPVKGADGASCTVRISK